MFVEKKKRNTQLVIGFVVTLATLGSSLNVLAYLI